MTDYSLTALMQFYDQRIDSGQINPATGKSHMYSVNRIAKNLPQEQQNDLRLIDVESAIQAFEDEHRNSFKEPTTIYTYQKRFVTGLETFLKAMENDGGAAAAFAARPNNAVELHIRINDYETEFKVKGVLTSVHAEKLHNLIRAHVVEDEL